MAASEQLASKVSSGPIHPYNIEFRSDSCNNAVTQTYRELPDKTFTIKWGFRVWGYMDNNTSKRVTGTVKKTHGSSPLEVRRMLALPNKTPYCVEVYSDREMDFEIYTDGTEPENLQGRWRIDPEKSMSSGPIARSANVAKQLVVLKADSSAGRNAGIKDDSCAGMVVVKAYPVTFIQTERYLNDMDGVVKCRKKKYTRHTESRGATRSFSAAGTAYGKKSDQTFGVAKSKSTVSDREHLELGMLLAIEEVEDDEFSSAYGHNLQKAPPLPQRSDFGF